MSDWINKYNIITRLFILVYILFFGWAVVWFMLLPNPSESQTVMITGLFGIGGAWYALYLKSLKGTKNGEETNDEENNEEDNQEERE